MRLASEDVLLIRNLGDLVDHLHQITPPQAQVYCLAQRCEDLVAIGQASILVQVLEADPPFGEKGRAVLAWSEMLIRDQSLPHLCLILLHDGTLRRDEGGIGPNLQD